MNAIRLVSAYHCLSAYQSITATPLSLVLYGSKQSCHSCDHPTRCSRRLAVSSHSLHSLAAVSDRLNKPHVQPRSPTRSRGVRLRLHLPACRDVLSLLCFKCRSARWSEDEAVSRPSAALLASYPASSITTTRLCCSQPLILCPTRRSVTRSHSTPAVTSSEACVAHHRVLVSAVCSCSAHRLHRPR